MTQAIRAIFFMMPLIFGIGFIAPVAAALMARMGLTPPFGLTGIAAGLILGVAWGGYATWRGRWL